MAYILHTYSTAKKTNDKKPVMCYNRNGVYYAIMRGYSGCGITTVPSVLRHCHIDLAAHNIVPVNALTKGCNGTISKEY